MISEGIQEIWAAVAPYLFCIGMNITPNVFHTAPGTRMFMNRLPVKQFNLLYFHLVYEIFFFYIYRNRKHTLQDTLYNVQHIV